MQVLNAEEQKFRTNKAITNDLLEETKPDKNVMLAINTALYSRDGLSDRHRDAAEKADAQPSISEDLQRRELKTYSDKRYNECRQRTAENQELQPSTSAGKRRCTRTNKKNELVRCENCDDNVLGRSLSYHLKWCNDTPLDNPCNFCGKKFFFAGRKQAKTNHQTYCQLNPDRTTSNKGYKSPNQKNKIFRKQEK